MITRRRTNSREESREEVAVEARAKVRGAQNGSLWPGRQESEPIFMGGTAGAENSRSSVR